MEVQKHIVKIYSTSACPWCTVAKNFFKEHKVEFEDINVAQNHKAAEEMIEKSGQMGVPVIEIDGQIIIGFKEDKIKQLLDIK